MKLKAGNFFLLLSVIFAAEPNGQRTDHHVDFINLYNYTSCKFLVIAHRGASYYAPENTMAAFRLAYEMGADMIELDVQLSKDGVPVVIHDADLSTTTSGRGRVADFLFEELRELDAGSWFSPRFSSEKILSLDEALKWAAGKTAINIEIKPEAAALQAGVEENVIALVQNYNMARNVIVSSFDPNAIVKIRRLAPEIKTGLLYDRRLSGRLLPSELVAEFGARVFHVNWRWLNNRWRRDLKENNIPVLAYTVNNERRMRQLIRSGVTGIFSDRPDLLKNTANSEIENRCSNIG